MAEAKTEAKKATTRAASLELPDEITGFDPFRKREVVWATHVETAFNFGGTDYEVGGWVLRDSEGNDSALSDEEFNAEYVPISPAKWDQGVPYTPPAKAA